MAETGQMRHFFAHEYKVNSAIVAPGTLAAFVTFNSADLYALIPTFVVIGKLLFVQVAIPGMFALARLIKRSRNDRRIDRQAEKIERLQAKLSEIQPQLSPMAQDEVARLLKEMQGNT